MHKAGEGCQHQHCIGGAKFGGDLMKQVSQTAQPLTEGGKAPTEFLCFWRGGFWRMRRIDGKADKNRSHRAGRVAEKHRAKTDGLGQETAEKRTECKAEIIDAVKAAENPAALILARQIDARDF